MRCTVRLWPAFVLWVIDAHEQVNGASPLVGVFHRSASSSSRKDGGTIRIESSCSDFRANGRDLVVLTVRDTSQRERRRIVRDSDRRFRTIFKAAPIGIVQCGSDGRVLETNPAVERMLGYSRNESRPVYFRDYLHPEDRETNSRLFNELARGERKVYEHDVRYIGKVGSGGWMHLKVSLVRGLRGEPQFAIAMIADITERKRAEERLRDAQKARDLFSIAAFWFGACIIKGMILLITPSARIKESAASLQSGTGQPVA